MGQHALWLTNSSDAVKTGCIADPTTRTIKRVTWEQDDVGWSQCVGTLEGHPLNLHLRWATVNNRRICFAEFTSRVSDQTAGEEWVAQRLLKVPKTDRMRVQVDGMNAHNVLGRM